VKTPKFNVLRSYLVAAERKGKAECALVSSLWSRSIQWFTWKDKHERTSCL